MSPDTCSKTPNPLISSEDWEIDVVVPVFNGERFVRRCLESILGQTHPPARIIVVDDGSTDCTREIVLQFCASDPRIQLVSQAHLGVSAARNRGVEASRAPLIAFIDSDDIWLPEKLSEQVAVFRHAGSDVGFVHSSYILIDETDEIAPGLICHPRLRGDIFEPLLTEGYPLSGSASSVLVRRRVLDKAGPWDESLNFAEDLDLWLRLAAISRVDFTPKALVGIRVHSQSSQRRYRPRRELDFLVQRLCVYGKWIEAVASQKGLIRRIRHDCLSVSARQVREGDTLFCVRDRASERADCMHLYKIAFPNDYYFLFYIFIFHLDWIGRRVWRLIQSPWVQTKSA